MRDIKFRAWHKTGEAMMPDIKSAYTLNNAFQDDTLIFMQFTGLTDKNGIDIYEGDIIGSQNTIGNGRCASHHVVSWHDTGLKGKQIGTYGAYIGIEYYTQGHNPYIVVGNIHENPELLNKQAQ